MMHDGIGFWGMGWFWWIFILIIILVVVLFLVRANRPRATGGDVGSKKSPREILEERYARGEIDKGRI